jgi:signal transduction histidine kinase
MAQFGRLDCEQPNTNYSIRLEGSVWWANPAQGRVVLRDATGAEELEMDLKGRSVRFGQQVRLEGTKTIVRRGAAFRIGTRGALVENDGTHRTTERFGAAYLLPGRHPFHIDWFNGSGKPGLEVAYQGPELNRQKIPDSALFRYEIDPASGASNMVKGVAYRCYEGAWETLPDFQKLTPTATGTALNFNLKGVRTRDRNVGIQFAGYLEVAREGLYTFYLKSAAGSRLFLGEPAMRLTVLDETGFAAPSPAGLIQSASGQAGAWAAAEGRVTQVREDAGGFEMELPAGAGSLEVELGEALPSASTSLLNRWIRAAGFCRKVFTVGGQTQVSTLLVPSGKEIALIETPSDAQTNAENGIQAALTTSDAVRRMKPSQAQGEYPFRIQGVVTCVQDDQPAFAIQDSTGGLVVIDVSTPRLGLPQTGEFLEIEGVTDHGTAKARRIRHLGAGQLPEPLHPGWDQFLSGSLDSQWVEISGLVESSINRSNGWSRLSLRIGGGVLKLDLRRAGTEPGPPERYVNAAVRLRGCLFADWQQGSLRLKVGQFRMYAAQVRVDQPAPADLFSIPTQSTASLTHFDPALDTTHRVKVSGQIVYVRGSDYFLMDGTNGLRFLATEPLGLEAGDRVEAVGFPELSGAAPVLRAAVARKIGHAALPEPARVPIDDLNNLVHDSTLVRVEGVLTSRRGGIRTQVFEIQAGPRRFLARLNSGDDAVRSLRPGSRLELVGVYCAQGGYSALGEDVLPVDLLINSPADIRVLATPPWWTLRKLLVIVGLLAFTLAGMLLWITELHRKVEQRTAELGEQIRQRQRLEHQREMEQERARIAQDLHDELGSDITEIGMLAARAKSLSGSDEERNHYLDQAGGKARQMVAALEEIVWAMNPGHDSVASLVRYFSFYADRFLGLAQIAWQLEAPTAPADYALDARLRHQLFLAFKEALANVVHHSGATEVRVSILVEQGELRLAVADNGRGLPRTGRTENMDGIANMKARIEKLGGSFEIAGQDGQGTTVRFRLPAR